MAASLSVLSLNSVPKMGSNPVLSVNRVRALIQRNFGSIPSRFGSNYGKFSSTRLNAAGLSEIEPDLNEDPKDRWATNGISQLRFLTSIISHYMSVTLLDDFVYGEYDGHHTYHEGHEKASFWESIAEDYTAIGPPTGFQGLISWLFLPAVAAGMYFNVRGEYLYIGAAVFTVIFCIIEMDKPSEPHNFEPQIYNMERGSRDKLIVDYNTMDIWDFNEKYGDLWDFTVKKDDIVKR